MECGGCTHCQTQGALDPSVQAPAEDPCAAGGYGCYSGWMMPTEETPAYAQSYGTGGRGVLGPSADEIEAASVTALAKAGREAGLSRPTGSSKINATAPV